MSSTPLRRRRAVSGWSGGACRQKPSRPSTTMWSARRSHRTAPGSLTRRTTAAGWLRTGRSPSLTSRQVRKRFLRKSAAWMTRSNGWMTGTCSMAWQMRQWKATATYGSWEPHRAHSRACSSPTPGRQASFAEAAVNSVPGTAPLAPGPEFRGRTPAETLSADPQQVPSNPQSNPPDWVGLGVGLGEGLGEAVAVAVAVGDGVGVAV